MVPQQLNTRGPSICDRMERMVVGTRWRNVYLYIHGRSHVDSPAEYSGYSGQMHRMGRRQVGCGNERLNRVHVDRRCHVDTHYHDRIEPHRHCVGWRQMGRCFRWWKHLLLTRWYYVDRSSHTERRRMAFGYLPR